MEVAAAAVADRRAASAEKTKCTILCSTHATKYFAKEPAKNAIFVNNAFGFYGLRWSGCWVFN